MKKWFAAITLAAVAVFSIAAGAQVVQAAEMPSIAVNTGSESGHRAGEAIPLNIKFTNTSAETMYNAQLRFDMPAGFSFTEDHNFNLGNLEAGKTFEWSADFRYLAPMAQVSLNKLDTIPEAVASAEIQRNVTISKMALLSGGVLVAGLGVTWVALALHKRNVRARRRRGLSSLAALLVAGTTIAAGLGGRDTYAMGLIDQNYTTTHNVNIDGTDFTFQVSIIYGIEAHDDVANLMASQPNRHAETTEPRLTAVQTTALTTENVTETIASTSGRSVTSSATNTEGTSSEETSAEPTTSAYEIPDYFEYTVEEGDSFSLIADKFDLELLHLVAYNGKSLADLVAPGDVLRIPASKQAQDEAAALAEKMAKATTAEASTTEESSSETTPVETSAELPATEETTEAPTTTAEPTTTPATTEALTTTTEVVLTTTQTTEAPTTATTPAPTTIPAPTTTTPVPTTTSDTVYVEGMMPMTQNEYRRYQRIQNWYSSTSALIGSTSDGRYNSYAWGWCTWYAYTARANMGEPVEMNLGNAETWARYTTMEVHSQPRVGSIGCDSANNHVFFVEAVYSDGSILISEGGAYFTAGNYRQRVIQAYRVGNYVYID